MEVKTNDRGFTFVEFQDRNHKDCSLQECGSNVEDAIWLGMNYPDIKEFYPLPRDTEDSWVEVDLDKLKHRPQNEMHAFSRMLLTREQVAELLPHLQEFVESGSICLKKEEK